MYNQHWHPHPHVLIIIISKNWPTKHDTKTVDDVSTKIQPLNWQRFWSGRHPINYLHITIVMFVGLFTITVTLKNTLMFQNREEMCQQVHYFNTWPFHQNYHPMPYFFQMLMMQNMTKLGHLNLCQFRITQQLYYQCNENMSCWCCIGIICKPLASS